MLVLSRKPGETIRIGENVTVQIRRVSGSRVVLALEAPREVRILRGELTAFDDGFGEDAVSAHSDTESMTPRPLECDHVAMV